MQPAPRTGFEPPAGRASGGQSPGKLRDTLRATLEATIPRVIAGVCSGRCPQEDAGDKEVPSDSSPIDEAGLGSRPCRPAL
eukprot:11167604-Heterocapsa_arctica.AAC.1